MRSNGADGFIPPLLIKHWRIQKYGTPNGDGWLTWPAGDVHQMSVLSNVYDAFMSMQSAIGGVVQWEKTHPGYSRIVLEILKFKMDMKKKARAEAEAGK